MNVETWHLYAAIHDGVQTIGMSFDGQSFGHRLGGSLNTATGGNFSLAQDVGGGNQCGAITIDDLAVFSQALQPYQLLRLFRSLG
jgi:hypothetical protein